MSPNRFVPTPGFERALELQPGVAAAIGRVTKQAEAEAIRLAEPISGRFADGLDSDVGIDRKGIVGRVNANWWGSLFVEFGTVTQRPQAILRRALDSVTRNR